MENAKEVILLSNGVIVNFEDYITVTTSHGYTVTGKIYDVGEKWISITDNKGDDYQWYYNELKDIQLVK